MGEWSGSSPRTMGTENIPPLIPPPQRIFCSIPACASKVILTLTPAGGMTAQLGEGWAIVNGYHYKNDGPLVLTFGYADGALDRIDTVVVRRDVNTRDIHAMVVAGTPAITPVAPCHS